MGQGIARSMDVPGLLGVGARCRVPCRRNHRSPAAATAVFLIWTYIFDRRDLYNNHYYLQSLLGILAHLDAD
ncbi:MAG: hypothetical protein U1D30_07040 [Planctomycetota bacterium]